MVAKASIIKNYAKADAAGKVDIICKNYSNFIGIVDGYTEGLCYMIENEKAYNRKQSRGDLGVRVQTSGVHSDITADAAISNVITKDAIIAIDTPANNRREACVCLNPCTEITGISTFLQCLASRSFTVEL